MIHYRCKEVPCHSVLYDMHYNEGRFRIRGVYVLKFTFFQYSYTLRESIYILYLYIYDNIMIYYI